MIRALCVYCGARSGVGPEYLSLAHEFGTALARNGITLIYGGGGTGMMGALADGALAEGGRVIGVVPKGVPTLEGLHEGAIDLRMVDSMHARKLMMFELGDAVAILPGGIGTLDEFFEVLTWKQLSIHDKPIYLLNAEGYWNGLLALLDGLAEKGFVQAGIKELFTLFGDVDRWQEEFCDQSLIANPINSTL